MAENKNILKIIFAVTATAVVFCLLAMVFADDISQLLGGTGITMEYESKLFNTDEIIDIDIQMSEDSWNEMLKNALNEEYYNCDVVINGETFSNVAIRPKGNTSLSAIVNDPDTDRYSFKLEFDHFVDGQTCYGLDKLILNNNYADATNMKEAIVYDMYQYIGADASLYNYAKISLNGEYIGVYLALEGIEQSFMLRNYGTQDGELYKPEGMGIGGGNAEKLEGGFGDFKPQNFDSSDFSAPDGDFPSMRGNMPNNPPDFSKDDVFQKFGENMKNFNDKQNSDESGEENIKSDRAKAGGMSMGGNGANLNYTDDDLDSYSTIWESEVTTTKKADHQRVVTALKNISEGTEIEKYLDVDNVLKYMAVHTFCVNEDSLSGNMAHNYYLYEYDGKLNILPWDYNLAFGGMSMGNSGNASDMINDAIDTPFSSTEFFDALLENENYLETYHSYLKQLTEEYVSSGSFEQTYNRIRNQIDELVASDPTAFYSYDEYDAAAEMLYKTVMLRAESIDGQIDGTIPSSDEAQRQNSENFIDASEIDLKVMGQFKGGGDRSDTSASNGDDISFVSNDNLDSSKQSVPTSSSDEVKKAEKGEDNNFSSNRQRTDKSRSEQSTPSKTQQSSYMKWDKSNIISLSLCFGIMLAALLLVIFYKRKL